MAVSLILSVVSGAVGGNMLGGALKKLSLGPAGNSIAGAVGGGLGAFALAMVLPPDSAAPLAGMEAAGSFSITGLLAGLGAGVGGGAVLTALVAKAKNMFGGGG